MNNDRINELYDRKIGTDRLQRTARRRIHWMCSRATGKRILDLGCSQGIASILLGREGRDVVGVDHEAAAIDAARTRLATEPEAVQQRVRFDVAEGGNLPFESGSFDCVLLGEVLEHQLRPRVLLESTDRVLREGGSVVITVPYGLFRYHDHKTSVYVGPLLDAVSEFWAVAGVVLIDRYLGLEASKSGPSSARPETPWREAIEVADRRVAALDEMVDEHARELKRLRSEAEALRAERLERDGLAATLDAARERATSAIRELDELRHLERKVSAELEMTRLDLARAEAERDEARRLTDAQM